MTAYNIQLAAAALFGLALGSFCGSAGYRIAHGWSLVRPAGSQCPGCGHGLGWRENIPLLSFALQRGRCRWCRAALSPLYPLAEASCACWSVLLFLRHGPSVEYAVLLAVGVILLLVSLVDMEARFIPDVLLLAGGLAAGGASWLGAGPPPGEALLAGAAGALLFQGVRLGYRFLRGGEGLGFGDVKLMALLGMCAGLAGLPFVLTFSALLACACTLAGRGRKVGWVARLPFGPYLCAGCAVYMQFGGALRGLAPAWGG
jgi:leader peptidase (prepilin peptidase)/N-methyltransferase